MSKTKSSLKKKKTAKEEREETERWLKNFARTHPAFRAILRANEREERIHKEFKKQEAIYQRRLKKQGLVGCQA